MSTTLESPSDRSVRGPVHRKGSAAYWIFLLCASLYLFPFMRFMLHGSDEGTLLYGAIRVLHGQVFARDFFEVMGPGTFYWTAAFFKLFGVTFMAARIGLFVSSLGTGVLMYFLSRRICAGYAALPVILLGAAYFGMLWPTTSHHVDSNFFGLMSVACLVVWLDRRGRGWLFAAGALAGTTLCFHQPKGLLLFASIALWIGWTHRRRMSDAAWPIASILAGFIGVIGIVLIYFWSQGALGDLIYANYLWPSHHYSGVNVVPYAHGLVREYWDVWAGTGTFLRWRILLAAMLIVPFCFVAAIPALLAVFGFIERKKVARPEIVLYWFCGWALWLGELHRKDIFHLVFGAPLLIVLSVYYLEKFRTKPASLTLQVLAITATCLGVCNLFLVLAARPMTTRFGTIHVLQPDPILQSLIRDTTPGEEIFAYPYVPGYYVLSGTVNPTRYSLLTYNYNTPDQFQQVVQTLQQRRIQWVVWVTGAIGLPGSWLFPLPPGIRRDKLVIEPYLKSHYNVVQAYKGTELLKRKTDAQ